MHLTVGEIGQILMLVGLVGFIASRLVTLVIKKLTSRRAVLFGVPFMLVGSIIIGMTHEVNIFVGGLIITGFGGFILKTCLYTQSNNVRVMSGNNRVSGFSAISNAGSLFAILIGSIFLSLLSTTTYIISLQILMSIVFVLVHNHLTKLDIVRGDGDKAEAKLPWFKKDQSQFWIIVVALFASTTAEFSVSDWGAILSRDDYQLRAPYYLLPFILFQAGIVVSRFLTNKLSEKYSEINYVRVSAISGSVIWGIAIQVVAHISHANHFLVATIVVTSFFIAGCGIGPVWPTMLTSATKSQYPAPVVLARLFSLISLAYVFGPGSIGYFAKLTSLSNALMIPIVSLFVVGLLAKRALVHEKEQVDH